MSGRLRITSIRLPTHIEAIIPQNNWGLSVITWGPGAMPWIIIAPIISAMTGLDGIPSVSSGMNDVCAPALLADSGPATPATAPVEDGAQLAIVKSPIVGTFYRSAEPGTAAFVNVGDTVKKGQVLCIIEAMKLMNEIQAEVSGEVVKIYVENGQPVEYGQPLFGIRK